MYICKTLNIVNKILYLVRKCTECGNIKSLTEFHRDARKTHGRRAKCKNCRKGERKKVDRAEKYKDFSTLELRKQKVKQNFSCKLCGKREYLVIDHCHKEGDVRGLLCNKCNLGLGFFRDEIKVLLNACFYLGEIQVKKKIEKNLIILKNNYQNFMNFIIN